jgi:hypothetical protein
MHTHDPKTEARLLEELGQIKPEELPGFLDAHREELLTEPRPFAAYMRETLRKKGVLQQNVFLAADLSENYGYKLVSEEKHTVNRDTILRLCMAAGFSMPETQEALILYGMAPLYVRLPRDAVFLVAIRQHIRDVHQVNALMHSCGLPPMTNERE